MKPDSTRFRCASSTRQSFYGTNPGLKAINFERSWRIESRIPFRCIVWRKYIDTVSPQIYSPLKCRVVSFLKVKAFTFWRWLSNKCATYLNNRLFQSLLVGVTQSDDADQKRALCLLTVNNLVRSKDHFRLRLTGSNWFVSNSVKIKFSPSANWLGTEWKIGIYCVSEEFRMANLGRQEFCGDLRVRIFYPTCSRGVSISCKRIDSHDSSLWHSEVTMPACYF